VTAKLSGPMLPPKSGAAPRRLMVLLHGYGADGSDLLSLGWQWRDLWSDMLFVAPNAPDPCDVNPAGYQWFALQPDRSAGRIEGVAQARPILVDFLMDLWAQTGVGPSDTVLCGFSQGSMMALNVGLTLDRPVAAVAAFSGALVLPDGARVKPPAALIHGADDRVLEAELSRAAARDLAAQGIEVALHISPGTGHGIAPDGLDFATSFLLAHLGATVGPKP
jgi:phospholipase/carboxylesterase